MPSPCCHYNVAVTISQWKCCHWYSAAAIEQSNSTNHKPKECPLKTDMKKPRLYPKLTSNMLTHHKMLGMPCWVDISSMLATSFGHQSKLCSWLAQKQSSLKKIGVNQLLLWWRLCLQNRIWSFGMELKAYLVCRQRNELNALHKKWYRFIWF